MNKLNVKLGRIELQNPVLCASGCFGHAYEAKDYTDLSGIGAVTIKTVTLEPRKGNPPHRIHEIRSGIMSSIGLQNPGFEKHKTEIMPKVQECLRPDQIFMSIAGGCESDYIRLAEKVLETWSEKDIAAIEINTACPNVQKGAGAVGKDAKLLEKIVSGIVKISTIPVVAKISTDFDTFCDSARAIEAGGADAVYLANTPLGMAINIKTGRTWTGNLKAPLNGPVVKPIGMLKTWDLYHAVKIPIIASGGVACAEDVVEYMMAGARAVGIGTMNFVDPDIANKVINDLNQYVEKQGLKSITELTGYAATVIEQN